MTRQAQLQRASSASLQASQTPEIAHSCANDAFTSRHSGLLDYSGSGRIGRIGEERTQLIQFQRAGGVVDVSEADALVGALAEKADTVGVEGLTEAEKDVMAPVWARAQISNGGFEAWLGSGRCLYELDDVARRFRALGCDAVADACEAVATALSSASKEAGSVDCKSFRPQQREVYKLSWDELYMAIGRYIEKHAREFAWLLRLQ